MSVITLAMPPPLPTKEEVSRRFEDSLRLFRERRGVLFISRGRFWEAHGLPHQSLGKYLSLAGIPVVWFDGLGWRNLRPEIREPNPHLKVDRLRVLPGRRLSPIRRLSDRLELAQIRSAMRSLGGNPIIWVVEGISEHLAEGLPYIDIVSPFDNPYSWPSAALERAKLVICQNRYSRNHFAASYGGKSRRSLPPLELTDGTFDDLPPSPLPIGFPEPVMGCVGSIMSPDFDMALVEYFVTRLRDVGFLFMGRLNEESEPRILNLRQFPNFHYIPWMPRRRVSSAWRRLAVTLLLYGDYRPQDGAFPTRALESFYFGIPCVANDIPKTADLDEMAPRSRDPERLIQLAKQAIETPKERIRSYYERLSYEMNPLVHLSRAGEFLLGHEPSDW